MKYIKTLEDLEDLDNSEERDKILSSVAFYLEEQQPIDTDDGFIECLFDSEELFCFTFSIWTHDETFDIFYDFLKNNNLEIEREFSYGDKWEIQIKLY